ncbi:MAG: D-aminoacyl-tRNA deacylase, partial [Clostridiales bacterium]|nr:D-aminoacyl-tRNA deacylase [Clostridiales bacterium]
MKIVLQRVEYASVKTFGVTIGEIGKGYVVLLGIGNGDTKEKVTKMAEKIKKLRIFADENGKTNLSIDDVCGGVDKNSWYNYFTKKTKKSIITSLKVRCITHGKSRKLYSE